VLADARGHLRRDSVGWARRPLWSCALPRRWGRRKRWCYWAVLDSRFFLSLDLGPDAHGSTPLPQVSFTSAPPVTQDLRSTYATIRHSGLRETRFSA